MNSCTTPKKTIDLTGKKFGQWTVIAYAGEKHWLCQCACGTEKSVHGGSLRYGRSNGCIKCSPERKPKPKHGEAGTRLYKIWRGMLYRCYNPNYKSYARYGGRGISVCPEWRDCYEAFRDWAKANGYAGHLTIDREDNNGNYEPGNCRWATRREQNRNRSDNKPVFYNGKTMFICDLAKERGLDPNLIRARLSVGWSLERAISTPRRTRKTQSKTLPEAA